MIELFVLWTPGAIASAVVGGLAVGLVATIMDEGRYGLRLSFLYTVLTGTVLFGVFYAGQIVDVFTQSGADTAARAVSRFLLAMLYTVMIGVGAVIGLWRRRRAR